MVSEMFVVLLPNVNLEQVGVMSSPYSDDLIEQKVSFVYLSIYCFDCDLIINYATTITYPGYSLQEHEIMEDKVRCKLSLKKKSTVDQCNAMMSPLLASSSLWHEITVT